MVGILLFCQIILFLVWYATTLVMLIDFILLGSSRDLRHCFIQCFVAVYWLNQLN